MAGIGVKLNNIYGKRTLTTNIIGMGYSTVMTIAPMLTVIRSLQHRRSTLYYPSTCRISFMRKPLRISFRVIMSG